MARIKHSKNDAESVLLPPDYDPLNDECYMGSFMREFFRRMLLDWRKALLQGGDDTIDSLQGEITTHPDILDRAAMEADHGVNLRARDRERKLIIKINKALEKIDNDEYGYCEQTSEVIGVKRLLARPIATLCLSAQEGHERQERSYNTL